MHKTPTPELALLLIQQNLDQLSRGEDASFLDLGNCGLTCIPSELAGLKHLKALNLGQFFVKYTGRKTINLEQYYPKDFSEFLIQESNNKGAVNRLSAEDLSEIGLNSEICCLYLTNLQLKDIGALNSFPNLEVLYLGNNELTDISPLRSNVKLRDLSLVQNKISDLSPLSNLNKLETLNLSRNKVSDLSTLAGLKNLSMLFIGNNLVSDLRPIASFSKLRLLVAFENNISSLDPLNNLVHLERIHLASNQISNGIPLQKLLKVKELNLRANQIKDISFLSSMLNLTILDMGNNVIDFLPPTLSLPYLTSLYFGNNRISDISPLSAFPALEVLDLSRNQIIDIAPLQNLSLGNLVLTGNNIQDIKPLGSLKEIGILSLEHNKIEYIEPFAFAFTSPVVLRLAGNPIKDIPLELVVSDNILKRTSSTEIDAYFKSIEGEKDVVHAAEVKIILVGNSTAGKTSLSRVLRGQPLPSLETSTHGIQIHQWKIRSSDFLDVKLVPDTPEQITVNIWDFGGQEYYHGTHQLFLDNNAIYILVWEPSTNQSAVVGTEYVIPGDVPEKLTLPVEQFHYRYWLDSIRFYASAQSDSPPPPIFMVQNKLDKEGSKVTWPEAIIFESYKVEDATALSAFLALSQKTADRAYHHRFQIFLDKLLCAIRQKALENLGRDRLAASWQHIRKAIQEATDKDTSKKALAKNPFARSADESQSLEAEKFRQACRDVIAPAIITDGEIDTLVRYLNSVGAVFYNPAVVNRVYLRPTVLTEKIYQILNQEVLRRKGRFTQSEASRALGRNQGKYAKLLIGLMARWEIIFPAPSAAATPISALRSAPVPKGPSPEEEWIATQYLPDDHPLEGLYQIAASGLEQNYFIVRSPLFHFKKALRQLVFSIGNDSKVRNKEFWKYGILFTSVEGNLRVLVKGVREENFGQILVYVEQRPENGITTQWEGEVFERIISAMTENMHPFSAPNPTQVSQTNNTDVFIRRAEKAASPQISRNGIDFVRIPDLLEQVRNEVILVPSYKKDGSAGKILSMADFAPFLKAFGQKPPKPTIFMSYSHEDLKLREELGIYLGPVIKRLKQADIWHDGLIKPGEPWDEAIKSKLRKADVVLLLISAHFIDSDYSWDSEMLPALERHKLGEARVIPILLSDCKWEDSPFAELEMVPKEPQNARLLPVTEWDHRAKALTTVVKRIQEVLQEMKI
ncbi:MAG: leucine-rich repeat domain-containing protein [Saprospiraceae bacterium]